jgi:plastocyanin
VTSTQSASTQGGSSTTTSQTTTTTATQTTATQTLTTSSSTTSSLPHGTQISERATGQQSPFYALTANESTFAAGSIHFNVYNTDQDPHTFAVADANGNQLTDATTVPAGHPQTPVAVTVTLPPGTYVLFCTLPQHAASGMETTIVVR